MAISLDVQNTKGMKVGTVELSEKIFESKVPAVVVHEVVNALRANRRRGTHSTKTRGEVSGGGLKPWKQKHTGRARSGSTRSPLWRHGGIIFGPKPRSYFQGLPDQKKKLSLTRVLSEFAREGRLRVIDSISVPEAKTKHVAALVKTLGLGRKTLLVVDKIEESLGRAARNLAGLQLRRAMDLNSYEALDSENLVITQAALAQLTQRLEN